MTDSIKALRESRAARQQAQMLEAAGSRQAEAAWNNTIRAQGKLLDDHADTILALLESREAAARAVVWAYDEWERIESFDKPMPIRAQGAHLVSAEVVRLATGKHPRDWTRPALMAHLGLTDGPTR